MTESPFKDAVRLLEDGFGLVKQIDASSWLIYIAGVGPFFTLLLHSINYLSDNPFATDYLFSAALGLAVLYLWMHICQSVFATRLLDIINLASPASLKNLFAKAAGSQFLIAPLKLIAWPVALFLVIPHSTVTMFFQHTLLLAEPFNAGQSWKAARVDAGYARRQAACLIMLVALFRATLLLNLSVLVFMAPTLWKAFTGLEGTLTRSTGLLQNPTTFAAVCILSYIGLDPLIKAVTAIRHFERRALTSGDDLRLKLLAFSKAALVLAAVLLVGVCAPHPLKADPSVQAVETKPITPGQMRSAIDASFRDRSSVWNLPMVQRPSSPSETKHFLDPVFQLLKRVGEAVDRWMKQLDEFLKKLSSERDQKLPDKPKPTGHFNSAWVMFAVFGLVLVASLVWWRRRSRTSTASPVAVQPVAAMPVDLENPSVRADEHSGEEWLELAKRYRAEGNMRYALRALYLSILSALARQSLISIGRGKSNRDYLREFQRRGKRLQPELVESFQAGLLTFEKSWYGTHAVSVELLDEYEIQASAIQRGAQSA